MSFIQQLYIILAEKTHIQYIACGALDALFIKCLMPYIREVSKSFHYMKDGIRLSV